MLEAIPKEKGKDRQGAAGGFRLFSYLQMAATISSDERMAMAYAKILAADLFIGAESWMRLTRSFAPADSSQAWLDWALLH